MILNVFTITELFIELVTLILMVWAGILSLVLGLRWQQSSSTQEKMLVEQKSHLVLLLAVIVLGIRLFNWPFFYATLQSLVPDISGAMCMFGVTHVERKVSLISELLKPISFFLIGAWLAIQMVDQKTETSPLMGRKLIILSLIAAVVAAESLVDTALILHIAPETPVTCCTTVTDVLDRPTATVPQSILGPQYASILTYAYFVGNSFVIMSLALVRTAMGNNVHARWRRPAPGIIFLCAIINAGIFLLTQIEVHAPMIMHLPYHRCLYCLWQYVPDTILMYSFFILATASTGWAFILDLAGRAKETESILQPYMRKLYGLSLLCFTASLIMNAVHLIVA